MGDTGDYWKDVKPYLNEKRKKHVNHMITSAEKNVQKLNLPYTSNPQNGQFSITVGSKIVDYWGTTGTWIVRKSKKRGKGMHSLRTWIDNETKGKSKMNETTETTIQLTSEDIATIIDSIIYNDIPEFEKVLNNGFEAIEQFSEALRESNGVFTLTKTNNKP